MKPQFQHELTTSFMMWADHFICSKADAFSNFTASLFPTPDERLDTELVGYSSPHKQWVFDHSIDGAIIPSGVYNGDEFIGRGEQGLMFDFDNGRALFHKSFGTSNLSVSGAYSVKDFNFYITNQTEEQLIVESKFDTNSRFRQDFSGIAPYSQVVPAIFVNPEMSQNEPFAFGGEDKTKTDIRCVVISQNSYQLDGALSVFADAKQEVFAKLSFEDYPLNEVGDALDYNYVNLSKLSRDPFFHIEEVRVSKLSDRVSKAIDPSLFVGFVDFEVTNIRYPRS